MSQKKRKAKAIELYLKGNKRSDNVIAIIEQLLLRRAHLEIAQELGISRQAVQKINSHYCKGE